MALTFQRIITPLNDLDLFRDTIANDLIIGDAFASILFYKPSDNLIKLKFVRDLEPDEVIHLYDLIDGYSEVLPSHCKIYRYIQGTEYEDKSKPPKEHDFKIGLSLANGDPFKLQQLNTIDDSGTLIKAEYFSAPDLLDKIVECNFAYTFDVYGDFQSRDKTVTWFREDGSAHPDTKVMPKTYLNPNDILSASQRRRKNSIDNLLIEIRMIAVPSILLEEQATGADAAEKQLNAELMLVDFIATHNNAMSAYINVGAPNIYSDVENDVTAIWLDNIVTYENTQQSIRTIILAKLYASMNPS